MPKKRKSRGVRGCPGVRPPQPGRREFWCRIDGKCHQLGERRADAERELLRILGERGRIVAYLTANALTEAFLDWSQETQPKTYPWYRERLRWWLCWLKDSGNWGLSAEEVRPHHLTEWLSWMRRQWAKAEALPAGKRKRRGKGGATEQHNLIRSVQRVWNWGDSEQRIDRNRIAKVSKPTPESREFIFSAEQFAGIFAQSRPCFANVLTALAEQGCRPGEVRRVEVRHVDLGAGVWRFPRDEHKTGRKTKRARVVYLTPSMVDLSRRLIGTRKTGHLFLNHRKQPWTKNALCLRFQRLRERYGLPAGAVAHALRHTFTTLARERGLDAATVAELLGHADSRMTERIYSHMDQRPEWLKEQARKAAGG